MSRFERPLASCSSTASSRGESTEENGPWPFWRWIISLISLDATSVSRLAGTGDGSEEAIQSGSRRRPLGGDAGRREQALSAHAGRDVEADEVEDGRRDVE